MAEASLVVIPALFLLACGVWFIVIGIKDEEKFCILLGAFVVLLITVPVTLGVIEGRKTNDCIKTTTEIKVTVTDKEYKAPYTIYSGKTMICHPAQYNIIISDGEIKEEIDDKAIYDNLKVGDKIMVNKNVYTKENGDIYKKELKLIENK